MDKTLEQLIEDRTSFEKKRDSLAARAKEYLSYLFFPHLAGLGFGLVSAAKAALSEPAAEKFYSNCITLADSFNSIANTNLAPELFSVAQVAEYYVPLYFCMRLVEAFGKRPNRYDAKRIAGTVNLFSKLKYLFGNQCHAHPGEVRTLRKLGKKSKYQKILLEQMKEHIDSGTFRKEEIYGSRNIVYKLTSEQNVDTKLTLKIPFTNHQLEYQANEPFTRHFGFDFAIKEGDNVELEYKRIELLEELCHGISITPIPVLGEDDKLVTAYVSGRNLLKTVKQNPKEDVVKAIATLAKLHRILYENKTKFEEKELINDIDYEHMLDKVFISRIPDNLKDYAKEETKFILDYLKQQEQKPIHGDFHPGNIIDPKQKNDFLALSYEYDYDVIIDYERLSNGLWEMDVSNLVDFCLYDFSFTEKMNLLNLHHTLTSDLDKSAYSEKLKRFYYSSLFKNMHMCGTLTYKMRQMEPNEDNVKCWNTFISQGIFISNLMAEKGHIGIKNGYSLTKLLNELRK